MDERRDALTHDACRESCRELLDINFSKNHPNHPTPHTWPIPPYIRLTPAAMAKDKLSANPVQAQRKAEKAKALKKGKSQLQTQRNEKLARRNPERLQKQIDDLKEQEAKGSLRPKDREILSQLEKDIRAIHKAREALGDKAPHFQRSHNNDRSSGGHTRGGRGGNVLGKRRRDGGRESDSSETDEDVKDIPMPRDTPPPVPRRNRNPNLIPVAERDGPREPHALPAKPPVEAKITYSSAPMVRDLRKEAVSKFIPSSVKVKPKSKKAETGVKQEALQDAKKAVDAATEEAEHRMMAAEQELADEAPAKEAVAEPIDIEAEEARFEREIRQVEMEEVPDEDL